MELVYMFHLFFDVWFRLFCNIMIRLQCIANSTPKPPKMAIIQLCTLYYYNVHRLEATR